jgi:beta-galactosidase
MKPKIFIFSFCFLSIADCLLPFDSMAQRQRISLDDDWRFNFGHADDPVKDFN